MAHIVAITKRIALAAMPNANGAMYLWNIGDNHYWEIVRELKDFGSIDVDKNQTIICIVGNKLAEKEGVLKEVFQALSSVPIRMVSFGGSNNNISLLVETSQKEKALNLLNEGLFGL